GGRGFLPFLAAILLLRGGGVYGQGARAAAAEGAAGSAPAAADRSHSHFGPAFDEGPRQQARPMKGIGNVHFPVTTSNRDAQAFFDQGINLLYSYWYYEAERAFRQAAMLDPDCAMAYWGVALSVEGSADRLKGA